MQAAVTWDATPQVHINVGASDGVKHVCSSKQTKGRAATLLAQDIGAGRAQNGVVTINRNRKKQS